MNIHAFSVEIAKEIGLECAILLQNFIHWHKINEANQKSFHDGSYWTFNSVRAYHELFEYMTPRKIQISINKLIDLKLLKKGNYNKVKYDRTNWYSLTDTCIQRYVKWITPEVESNTPEVESNTPEVEPIPYIEPNIITDIKTDKNSSYISQFNICLNLYGKKTHLMDAKLEWSNLLPIDEKRIAEHIPRFIENHRQADKMKYLPRLANYLSGRRWEDQSLPYETTQNDNVWDQIKKMDQEAQRLEQAQA